MKDKNKVYNDIDMITQAELSRALGVSPPYISKLVKTGVLVFKDKKIQLALAKKSIKDNADPTRAYKKKENQISNLESEQLLTDEQKDDILNLNMTDFLAQIEKLTFNDAKTKSEQMSLITQKIKIEKDLNNLVPIEGVQKNAFDLSKKLRDSLLAIPDRICDIIASESDARVIHNTMTEEIKQSLEDIIHELSKNLKV